jgi:uncharacterized protein YbjT (DUF2867 family)
MTNDTNTPYAVVGGAGTVGRHIVDALRARAPEVRVLSRSSASHPVDLTTGEGLEAALAGVAVVVDASNGSQRNPRAVLVEGARRLLDAAHRAGVSHIVLVSIVGIEQVPMGYYRAKIDQEQVVTSGPLAWSIVRSTQFHELVDAALSSLGRLRLGPRSAVRLQPVSAREAGHAVAAAALDPQPGTTLTVAGPRAEEVTELSREWATAHRRGGLPVRLPLPGRFGRPLRAGALTCEHPDRRGTVSFASWLMTQS